MAKKDYTYTYDEGRISRAAESDITVDANEIVTSKTLVSSIYYVYDSQGTLTGKRIVSGSMHQDIDYPQQENENTKAAKVQVGNISFTSSSTTDSLGRKASDSLQLGTKTLSRTFAYHEGQIPAEYGTDTLNDAAPSTRLVSSIVLSNGRNLSYEYDAEERITKVIDSVEGTTEYTYDALGQLLTEKVGGVAVNTMTYDNYGNILTKNGKTYTYGDSVWKDRLTAYNGQTITYDAQGNPIEYLGNILTWEKGRQLKSFCENTYTYNANGIRTSKTVGDVKHTYTLDGAKILKETWGSNTLIPVYDIEETVCGIVYNGTPFYFQKNLQGDIIGITNASGTAVARYNYDAWGACTTAYDTSGCNIAAINPYRYRSYYYDDEIHMYYLQSRYYDPVVGRFINADDARVITVAELGIECNLFTYCNNNPTSHIDASGSVLIPWQVKVGLVAGVASTIWEVVKYVASNWFKKKTAWDYIKGLILAAAIGFIRGFVVGLLSTIKGSLRFGLLGGTLNLILGIYNGTVNCIGTGIAAFLNGWTNGVVARTLTNIFGNLIRLYGMKKKTAEVLEFILAFLFSEELLKKFAW